MAIIGVIADTHVPDRVRHLHPNVTRLFREAGVEIILHAGDITTRSVLRQLGEVAPILAVRGNRDWFWHGELPLKRTLDIEGVTIGLTHGHGSWVNYLLDRSHFLLHGYSHEWLLPRLLAVFPQAQVIVFGHGHLPLNRWMNGQLLFNPGSPHFPDKKDLAPSIGLLHISAGSEVRGEIIELI
jgi:hypothetical protein